MEYFKRLCIFTFLFFALNQVSYSQTQFYIYPHGHIKSCPGKIILVEAAQGYSSYLWSSGEKTRTVKIFKSGKYICTAYDSNGNHYRDSVMVEYYPLKQLDIFSIPNPPVICAGDKIVLKASAGFASYTWSNGVKGSTIDIKPEISKTAVLIALDSNGCEYKDSIYIKVNNCDSCNIIQAGKTSICRNGDSVILEAKYGFSSYLWSNQHTGRILIVKTPGKYLVEAIDSNGKKCKDSIEIKFGMKALKLETLPNPPIVCKNQTVILEATKGFIEYNWSIGGKGNRVEYLAEISKKITLHATDSNGCVAGIWVEVTVKDTCKCSGIISAWPRNVLCGEKDSIQLEAKKGFKTYKWWNNQTGRLLWIYKPGWYYLEVTDSNGNKCRDSIHIYYAQLPELKIYSMPNPPCVQPHGKIILEASNGFKYYHWSNGMTGPRIELFPEKDFELKLEAITENGCVVTKAVKICILTSGISEIPGMSGSGISIFPNPVSGNQFRVSLGIDSDYQIELFDITGKQIQCTRSYENGIVTISFIHQVHGVLLVRIKSGGRIYNGKLMVE